MRINDVLYGSIELTDLMKQIIETDEFLRLNNILQMSFAYLDYPGARHTRFEHSIGAVKSFEMIFRKIFDRLIDRFGLQNLANDLWHFLRLAMLLHDFGHPPLSHIVEKAFYYAGYALDHEELTREKIRESFRRWISEQEAFRSTFENNFSQLMNTSRANSEQLIEILADIATGKYSCTGNLQVGRILSIASRFISGPIDADKLDYISRDCYYAGLSVGIELRLLDSIEYDDTDDNIVLNEEQGITLYASLLDGRLKLQKLVHDGLKNRLASFALMEIIADILDLRHDPEGLKGELIRMNDLEFYS